MLIKKYYVYELKMHRWRNGSNLYCVHNASQIPPNNSQLHSFNTKLYLSHTGSYHQYKYNNEYHNTAKITVAIKKQSWQNYKTNVYVTSIGLFWLTDFSQAYQSNQVPGDT